MLCIFNFIFTAIVTIWFEEFVWCIDKSCRSTRCRGLILLYHNFSWAGVYILNFFFNALGTEKLTQQKWVIMQCLGSLMLLILCYLFTCLSFSLLHLLRLSKELSFSLNFCVFFQSFLYAVIINKLYNFHFCSLFSFPLCLEHLSLFLYELVLLQPCS